MRNRIGQLLQVRPGEGVITCLMFSYVAWVLAFYYILKPMRSALFLKDLPATDLPNAYLLTAFVAAPLVTLVFRCSRRLSVIALISFTQLGVIGSLLLFRWAVAAQFRFLPYAYFAYVQIVSVVCISQFWLLAGCVFDGRQARRIYGLLGAGAITGCILGSLVTDLLKDKPMTAMLGICAGICAALIGLAHLIWRRRAADVQGARELAEGAESAEGAREALRIIFGSRLLKLLVSLVFLTMIASQIADWQVDYAAQQNFSHLPKERMEEEIKSFRARFNAVTNVAGIVLQLTVTRFVIQRAGIWAAVLFLPAGLGIASLGVLFAPSLRTAAIALGCSSVFRYSVHRSGLELLFLPLSPRTRQKTKLFIDVFVDRVGRAVAAFIILALTTRFLPAGLPGTAAVVAGLTCACFVVGLKLRRGYVDAFRQQLARREVDLTGVSRHVTDPASLRLLVSNLESGQERRTLYALGLLQSARGLDFSPQLLPLLGHPSPFVREEAVRTLHALPGNHDSEAERLLGDAADGVRNAAISYLVQHSPDQAGVRLQEFLNHANPDIRIAAAACAADQPESVFRPSMDLIHSLTAINGARSIPAHQAAARLAARLPAAESGTFLRRLFLDPRPEVAAGAVVAAGRAAHTGLVSEILPMLTRRDLRAAARQALLSIGTKITPDLAVVLGDEDQEVALRCEIPWIFSRLADARAAGALMENINAGAFHVKYQVVKALSRMHARNPELPGNNPLITVHVIAQTLAYYEELALIQALDTGEHGDGRNLAARALQERLDGQLEVIFRLLGLGYPQKDIYYAYSALKDSRPGKRIPAIEFLDNLLKKDVKLLLLPLLEEKMPERILARAAHPFGVRVPTRNDALGTLLLQPDPWLKACALHTIGSSRNAALEDLCRRMLQDRDPRVRETAGWTLERMSRNRADEYCHADTT